MKQEEMYHNASLKEHAERLPKIENKSIIEQLEEKKQQVLEGFEDGYKLYLFVNTLKKQLDKIQTEIKEITISEIENNNVEFNGFKFETMQGGRYDYSVNEEWNKLNEKKKEIEKNMQIAYKSKTIIFDKETGEIIKPAIYNSNKQSIKITKIK